MSNIPASRRRLIGSGAALLLLAPFAAGTAKAAELNGNLLRLCALLEDQQAEVRRVADDPSDEDKVNLDATLDDWWDIVDTIAETAAKTPEGIRAKAAAVRTAIVGTHGDAVPQVSVMLASLLSDMLGETVDFVTLLGMAPGLHRPPGKIGGLSCLDGAFRYAVGASLCGPRRNAMCNLYSMTKGQQAIRELIRAMKDRTANLPILPGVFPDYAAPIVREGPEGRELAMARWGMPSPVFALQGKKSDPGVTNVRNTKSPYWRRWLGVESRCLVPFTSYSEPDPQPDGSRPPIWFALDDSRPLAFFAGIWTPRWASVRKVREGETTNDLFAFLTTDPNAEVGAAHPKAMPVILTTPEEWELWLTAPPMIALGLQRPAPDGSLVVVGRGSKNDGVPSV